MFILHTYISSWVFCFPPAPHIHQGSSLVFHGTRLMRTCRVPALHTWNTLPDSAPPPYIWVTPTFVKSTARNQISSSKYVNNEKDVLNCPAGYPTEGLFKRAPFVRRKSLQQGLSCDSVSCACNVNENLLLHNIKCSWLHKQAPSHSVLPYLSIRLVILSKRW